MIKLFIGKVTSPANGQWFDLDEHDIESLQDAVIELHGDDETIISDCEGLQVDEHESLENCIEWNEAFNDCHNSDALLAYIELHGVHCIQECIDSFDDAYYGAYDSHADFAEDFYTSTSDEEIPSWVVVDWDATYQCNLQYDFIECNGYYFNRNI